MKVSLVDPMPVHPSLCYPGTARPLVAVGLRSNGEPLWPLLGAEGEGEDTGDEGEEGDSEDETEDEEADEEEVDDDAKGKSKKKKSGPVSRDEFEAVTRRLSNADRRRAEAEKKANDLQREKDEQERKGKPELDNVKKDLEKITAEHGTLKDRFAKLARVNAFLTASAQEKIAWHDPKVAQRAADLEELEIDEDGNVEGIREAVKALAKKAAYLVNTGKANEEDDDKDDKSKARRGTSGSGVGSTKTGAGRKRSGTLTDEELRKRFPALNR